MRSVVAALALLLLALPGHADPVLRVPPRCVALDGEPGYCIGAAAIRSCDGALGTAEPSDVQLAACETRRVAAAADARRLDLRLGALRLDLGRARVALAEERSRLPAWTWTLVGAAGGAVLTVAAIVLAVVLAQ